MGARAGDRATTRPPAASSGTATALEERVVPADGDLVAAFRRRRLAAGERLFVADLRDRPAGDGAARRRRPAPRCSTAAPRTTSCGPTAATQRVPHRALRAMKADALAQYLVWKRWHALVPDPGLAPRGRGAGRRLPARGREVRRQDRRGAGLRGHRRRPAHRYRPCAGAGADAGLHPGRAATTTCWWPPTRATSSPSTCPITPGMPRPVAGTAGLVPAAWSRSHEQWGGTQLQRRFEKLRRPADDRARLQRLGGAARASARR